MRKSIFQHLPLDGEWGDGRGYSLWWPEAQPEKGYLFQASGTWKGRDFTSWSIWKGREICHLGLWRGKRLTDEFYGFTKSGKRSILWLFPIQKTVHLHQLKGMQSSTQGMWKGYHLSKEGIRKGYRFREKCKGKGLDLGAEPPCIPYISLNSCEVINNIPTCFLLGVLYLESRITSSLYR